MRGLDTVVAQIISLAQATPTVEVCGIVSTSYTLYPIRNAAQSSARCFSFDRREYFEVLQKLLSTAEKVLFVYHSHPSGDPSPSKADLKYTTLSKIEQIIVSPNGKVKLVTNA